MGGSIENKKAKMVPPGWNAYNGKVLVVFPFIFVHFRKNEISL